MDLKFFNSRKNDICNASRMALSIFDPLFANIMDDMNRKLDEKFGKISFDESVAIYEKITDGSESDFVNMLMAQNKDVNKTEVCRKRQIYLFLCWHRVAFFCWLAT